MKASEETLALPKATCAQYQIIAACSLCSREKTTSHRYQLPSPLQHIVQIKPGFVDEIENTEI